MDYDNGISFIRIYLCEYKGAQSSIGNGLCAKDMLLISWPVSTMLYIGISVIKTMILTYIDNKPNILIRYNSKKKYSYTNVHQH